MVRRSQADFEIDLYERILNRDPYYVEVLVRQGELFAEKGWHRRTLHIDQRLAQIRPQDPAVIYNLACSYALLHQFEDAMQQLKQAVVLGFSDYRQLMVDPDLAALRLTQEFVQFVRELRALETTAARTV